MVTLGVASSLAAYAHLLFGGMLQCLRRILMLGCGIWTEELIDAYCVLQRAALADIVNGDYVTSQDSILQVTAAQHALYWLFIPGFALLTKMST